MGDKHRAPLVEAEALLAAYGSRALDEDYADWQAAVAAIEDAYLASEMQYVENSTSATRSTSPLT